MLRTLDFYPECSEELLKNFDQGVMYIFSVKDYWLFLRVAWVCGYDSVCLYECDVCVFVECCQVQICHGCGMNQCNGWGE